MNDRNEQKPIDRRAFRDALGAFATGVTIVTTRSQSGEDIGITANSFNSVSLDPPMILWSLARNAKSLSSFTENPWFAVHVLADDQDSLSQRFATQGVDKFKDVPIRRGEGGIPLLEHCSALFECHIAHRHEGGDHVIFIGSVINYRNFHRAPLLFYGGRYAVAVGKSAIAHQEDPTDSEPDSSFSRDFLIYLLGRAHFQLSQRLKQDLLRYPLSEAEWFVLSLLGIDQSRSIAELDRLLWHAGHRVDYGLVARLAALGLIELREGHDPDSCVSLTTAGREIVLEIVSAAKAVEANAERNLGPGEVFALKQMLRRIVADMNPGPPPLALDTSRHGHDD